MVVTHEFYEELFSAVFALYFAANIAASRDYNAFDTAAIMAGDHKALWRCLIGILFLNVVPVLYYEYVVHMIHEWPSSGSTPAWSWGRIEREMVTLFLGTAGAGFYRIFAGIMVCRKKNGRFLLYADRDKIGVATRRKATLRSCMRGKKDVNRWGFYTRPCGAVKRAGIGCWHHIGGGALYLAVPIGAVWAWVRLHGVWWR